MINLLLLPISLLTDRLFGEPRKYHPLVGFGVLANWLETRLNQEQNLLLQGVIAWSICVIPITLIIYWLDQWIGGLWLGILCGWLAIGWQSLREHGLAVMKALNNNDIKEARLRTSYLVSRDTSELNESDLSKATIESILENGSDAIFAPLFWLLLLGAPGVVLYRLSNTLDAMWGYHNERFEYFGKFTARIDDILNIIPARICALLYLIFGNSKQAWLAWKTQGRSWYSPNAGVVMAAGAGALKLKLGGNAIYQGTLKERPNLGNDNGNSATPQDIQRAIQLIDNAVYGITIAVILLHFCLRLLA